VNVIHQNHVEREGGRGSQRDVVYLGLTNSALVYKPKSGGRGVGVAGSQPMSTAVHMEPK
jgi:hypothetical protein